MNFDEVTANSFGYLIEESAPLRQRRVREQASLALPCLYEVCLV